MTNKDDGATKSMSTETGMGVGITLGGVLGAAFDNGGMGLAIGVTLGAGLGGALHKKKTNDA